MTSEYHEWGVQVELNQLTYERAVDFVHALSSHDYAKIIGTVKKDDQEGAVFELQPEIPTHGVVDVRKTERVCVVFPGDAWERPDVRVLRKSFPREVLHVNMAPSTEPCSLCLFAQDYREVARSITGSLLLRRVFEWFSRAAHGDSHLPGQPLEPFVLAPDRVIFRHELLSPPSGQTGLVLRKLNQGPPAVYRVESMPFDDYLKKPLEKGFLAIPIQTKPWHARLINEIPASLEDLDALLQKVGIDLAGRLCQEARTLYADPNHQKLFNCLWILLLTLPRTREHRGDVESTEEVAFFVLDPIGPLGEKLGVLSRTGKTWALLIESQAPTNLADVRVVPARTISAFSRRFAMELSGATSVPLVRITAIGAGAIGSQIILDLARQGIGKWVIIDEDSLLPHNHARHALSPKYEGIAKATALADEINVLMNDPEAAKAVVSDAISLCSQENSEKPLLLESDHILDFSISPAVMRTLAGLKGQKPVTSVFLLHGGHVLAILSEGLRRQIRLDDLDIQLYAASVVNRDLKGLFEHTGDPAIRYSAGCRDVTTVLAQDTTAIQSGIASSFLKANMSNPNPSISVWRLEDDLSVSRINVSPQLVSVLCVQGWEVRISDYAAASMRKYRQEKSPNETGGVLVGAFDVPLKTVYVGMALPSPPDSKESPEAFVRGIQGVVKQLDTIGTATGGNLAYVGEWHSHPTGCAPLPGGDDIKALKSRAGQVREDGYPAVMLIQGDDQIPCVVLQQ